jgi:hypothetical protein
MSQFGGKDSKRHFTVVMGNKEHGLYISSTPSSAAKKAVTKLCASNKSKKVEFHIREITQGSKKKTYGLYEGYIEKLKKPIELKGRVIRYKPVAKLSNKSGKKMKGGMLWEGMKPVERTDDEEHLLIATIKYDNPPQHNNSVHQLQGDDPKYLEYLHKEQIDWDLKAELNKLDSEDITPKQGGSTLCYIKQNELPNNSPSSLFNIYIKSKKRGTGGYYLKPLLEREGRAINTITALKNIYKLCNESGYCTFNFISEHPSKPSKFFNSKNENFIKYIELLKKKITSDTHNTIYMPFSDNDSN